MARKQKGGNTMDYQKLEGDHMSNAQFDAFLAALEIQLDKAKNLNDFKMILEQVRAMRDALNKKA